MTSDELFLAGIACSGTLAFFILILWVCFAEGPRPASNPDPDAEPGPANPPDGSAFARKVIEANAAKDRQCREEDARRKAIRPVFREWLKREVESGSFDLKGKTLDEVVDSTSFASLPQWMDIRSGDDKGGVNETGTTPRPEWKPIGHFSQQTIAAGMEASTVFKMKEIDAEATVSHGLDGGRVRIWILGNGNTALLKLSEWQFRMWSAEILAELDRQKAGFEIRKSGGTDAGN